MCSLAIGDKLQAIKEIAIGGCEDIEVSEKIFDLCDEILGLVNSASCNCKHNSNSRDNEPCCTFDCRTAKINKATQILVYTVRTKPKNRRQVYEVFKTD